MSNQARQAKEALGTRLREIRRDANLTGRTLARRTGFHYTKVSKLENGVQTPSEDDLRAWCAACGAEDQVADLIVAVRHVEELYLEWRRINRTGMRRTQDIRSPLYEKTGLFRIYEPGLVPGLFQTAEYAAAIISRNIEVYEVPNDLDQAVAARMELQHVLYSRDRRFHVVLEEQALRTRVGTVQTMHGQLDRLLTVMGLHRLNLGIIPATGERRAWPLPGFWIFDQGTVRLETPSAELTITQRMEVAVYEKEFEFLRESAVYGPHARGLITAAARDLPAEPATLRNASQPRGHQAGLAPTITTPDQTGRLHEWTVSLFHPD